LARNSAIETNCRRRLYGTAERQFGFGQQDLRLRRTRRRKADAYVQRSTQSQRRSPVVLLSSPTSALTSCCCGRGIPVRWFDTEEVMDEEILQQSLVIGPTCPMITARYGQEIELLVGLDQGVHHLVSGRWIDVGIQFRNHQQQLALKA